MIRIINHGCLDKRYPMGLCEYEVLNDDEVVAVFTHRRSDGLCVCLEKAAKAVAALAEDDERLLVNIFRIKRERKR